MDAVFSFRLDEETSEILHLLAGRTLRTRSGVVRWLIHNAALNNGLLPPEYSTSIDNADNIAPTTAENGKHRKVRL